MTRSRSISGGAVSRPLRLAGCSQRVSRLLPLLALLLFFSSAPAWAQGAAETAKPRAATDSVAIATTTTTATNWTTVWAVLGGVAIGVLGAWLWARRAAPPAETTRPLVEAAPEVLAQPARQMPAQNVWKSPVGPASAADAASMPAAPASPAALVPSAAVDDPAKNVTTQSLREVQGVPKPVGKSSGNKKSKPNFNSRSTDASSTEGWPQVPHRPAAMNPTSPANPPASDNQSLESGQTIEWAAPTSTPPAIQELIAASAPAATPSPEAFVDAAAPAPANGPVHYYAPAPDVPSIEHRKLSPNPLPQMPLLITLPHAAAETAQFSFSPQADQSRIIGNGVRELKEFFQFELPPTEQFTTIQNLKPGRLEKRDDAWHVVQKAEIALS